MTIRRRRRSVRRGLALALATVLAVIGGCTATDKAPEQAAEAPLWSLSEQPVLEVGELDGPEEELFTRLTDGEILADGRVMLLDRGSGQLRFFTRDGRIDAVAGGMGDGPGEFRLPQFARMVGDHLVIFDARRVSVSYFSQDGAFLSSDQMDLARTGYPPAVETMTEDGRWVVWRPDLVGATPPPAFSVSSRPVSIIVEGDASDTLITVDGEEWVRVRRENQLVGRAFDLGRRRLTASTDGFTLYGSGIDDHLLRIGHDGRIATIPVVIPARPLTDDWFKRYSEATLAGREGDTRDFLLTEAPRPERLPFFDDLHLDDAGRIWLRQFDPPFGGRPLVRAGHGGRTGRDGRYSRLPVPP